jgi:putative membrane protein
LETLILIVAVLLNAFVIWIVGKLRLGLTVSSFAWAILAAIVITVLASIITVTLAMLGITIGGGLMGAIVTVIVAAAVLLVSDKLLKGLKVAGFGGAIVAAIAIAALSWLLAQLMGAGA